MLAAIRSSIERGEKTVGKGTRTASDPSQNCPRPLSFSDAVDADDYVTAERLVKVAQASVAISPNPPLTAAVKARAKEVADLRKDYEAVAPFFKNLARKPDDPDANILLGRFYAFHKGDWEWGLPLLKYATGEPRTAALAKADLTVERESKAMEAVGDQ
jgi:hypothetical protein